MQDLQTDVFGGAMSGKYWDMYKGKTSYDDDGGGEAEDEEGVGDVVVVEEDGSPPRRQIPEQYQIPEPQVREERRRVGATAAKQMLQWAKGKKRVGARKDHEVVDSKEEAYSDLKKALLKDKDAEKLLLSMLQGISKENDEGGGFVHSEKSRREAATDSEETGQNANDSDDGVGGATQRLEEFVKKFNANVPDPIVSTEVVVDVVLV